jgi:hypothetical protein
LDEGLEAPKGSSTDVFMEFKHAKHTLANARLLARAARVMDVANQFEFRTLQLEEAIASKVALSAADKTELEALRVVVSSVFAPTERMVFSNAVVALVELSATWTQARLFKIEFMAGEGNAGEAAAIFEKRISGHLSDQVIAEKAALKKALRKLGRAPSTSVRGGSSARGRGRGGQFSASSSSHYVPNITQQQQQFVPYQYDVPPNATVAPATSTYAQSAPWLQQSGGGSFNTPNYSRFSRGAAARGRGGRHQPGAPSY